MRTLLIGVVATAGLLGATICLSPEARADAFGFTLGINGGVGFSYSTGGYCDQWGCPEDYWDYPVYYGPVYVNGNWFRGPVYYRVIDGEHYYWVHGGWHEDEWDGPPPDWAGPVYYGPALGLKFYHDNGFRGRGHGWDDWGDRSDWYRWDPSRWHRWDNDWKEHSRDWDDHRDDWNRRWVRAQDERRDSRDTEGLRGFDRNGRDPGFQSEPKQHGHEFQRDRDDESGPKHRNNRGHSDD